MKVSSLLPHICSLHCQRRSGKTFSWEKYYVSTGKQGGLAEQKAQLCPLLPATIWLQSARRSLCPQPGTATAGHGSQRQLHGTACEKLHGVSSHLAALSFAPSPHLHFPSSPQIAGSWQWLLSLQWVPLAFWEELPAAAHLDQWHWTSRESPWHFQHYYDAEKTENCFFLHISVSSCLFQTHEGSAQPCISSFAFGHLFSCSEVFPREVFPFYLFFFSFLY